MCLMTGGRSAGQSCTQPVQVRVCPATYDNKE